MAWCSLEIQGQLYLLSGSEPLLTWVRIDIVTYCTTYRPKRLRTELSVSFPRWGGRFQRTTCLS